MAVNWGLSGGNGFQNALATGLQIGQSIKADREEEATSNALSGFLANPTQDDAAFASSLKGLPTQAVGQLMQARQGYQKTQQQQTAQRLQAAAAQGDKSAMAQLAGIDFDAWSKLDTRTRDVAKERSGVLANAALDVLNKPPEQRAAAWDSYIGQLSQDMPELAQYRGQYSEAKARSVVAQAELIGKLQDQERPDYQVVPKDATLVNTRDNQAIQDYSQGASSPSDLPPPPPGFQLEGGPTQPASGTF